ncbi:hypothetical protein SH580_05585 [Coraliomargarita algicola]|uniref:Uncharacterized protein n=1 Tax=Coraliomargarita algicola TaxID=3092156 RepID=A0ABZ0RPL6_9BACT|nr:hypothetical protein [Coraliomargarita sp. J2-16]WPJ97179.1 hypothetical protein SH580_05585 [Coraliomargarita sp. J2-16]
MKFSACTFHLLAAILLFGGISSLFGRSAQVLYFKAPKNAPQSVHIYQSATQSVEVDLKRNNFSKSFNLEDGAITLRFLGTKLQEGQEFPVAAPSLEVPADYDKVLILAFANPRNPVFPVRFKVIKANDETFGPGDRMFINFTDYRIVGNVGNQKLDLASHSIKVVSDAAKPKQSYQVRLDRVDPAIGKPYTFIRQAWRQSSTKRVLIFVYSAPGSGSVTYYSAPVHNL